MKCGNKKKMMRKTIRINVASRFLGYLLCERLSLPEDDPRQRKPEDTQATLAEVLEKKEALAKG